MSSVSATNGSNKSNSSSSSDKKSAADLDSFKNEAKKTLLNLSTSNDKVIDFITKSLKDSDSSPEKQFIMQQILEMRSQIASAMSNALRTLHEASQSIINNLR